MVESDWSGEVEALCELMTIHYLHAEVAERVNVRLRDRLNKSVYAAVTDERAFSEIVTADTVTVSGDLHLRLRYSAVPIPHTADLVVPESGRRPEEAEAEGHGFARVERLEGDIGLIDIRRFFPLSMSRHAATAAMHEIAGTDALIVDLRQSQGGEPEMVSYLCSFLFDERVHLNDLYFPKEDRTVEWWTDPSVARPIFGGSKPVFVLTSSTTISAAEEFAYDLQQLQRALVIGEATAGAANFDYRYRVSDHLMFSVPSGYPINPVSGQHWERTGVRPDIEVPADAAFDDAYELALTKAG